MLKTIMLMGGTVLPVSAAQAQAAWDVAPRWICRGDTTATCDNEGTCKNGESRAMFDIDFAAGTITNLNNPNGDGATIAMRKSSPAAPYDMPKDFKGTSYFYTSGQQTFLIEQTPTDNIMEPFYRLRMITSYGGGDTIHYGTCVPRRKVP